MISMLKLNRTEFSRVVPRDTVHYYAQYLLFEKGCVLR